MKVFRMFVVIFCVITALVYGYSRFFSKSGKDLTFPAIAYTRDVLDVSVFDNETALLEDVTAYDEKDGDLTERVIIEQVSNFIETGISNITYAVADNDDHIAKATRRIRYIDYESPRFTFLRDMRFELGAEFNVLEAISAADKLDGDLTSKIKLTRSDLNVNIPGVYKMQAQVTNSKGDASYLKFNVTMYEGGRNAARVLLKDYLVYIKAGDRFNAESYIDKIMRNGAVVEGLDIKVDSNVDAKLAGNYQVDYAVTDENDAVAVTSLIVMVEE